MSWIPRLYSLVPHKKSECYYNSNCAAVAPVVKRRSLIRTNSSYSSSYHHQQQTGLLLFGALQQSQPIPLLLLTSTSLRCDVWPHSTVPIFNFPHLVCQAFLPLPTFCATNDEHIFTKQLKSSHCEESIQYPIFFKDKSTFCPLEAAKNGLMHGKRWSGKGFFFDLLSIHGVRSLAGLFSSTWKTSGYFQLSNK